MSWQHDWNNGRAFAISLGDKESTSSSHFTSGVSACSQRIWHSFRKVLTYLFVPAPNPVNSVGFFV